MTDYDDLQFLFVEDGDEDGTYRLVVCEIDPMSEASSVEQIIEGTLEAIVVHMDILELTGVPILIRHSDKLNHAGEVLSACGSRVLEPPRATPLETLNRAIEIREKPPTAFEDVTPRITGQEVMNVLVKGLLLGGQEYEQPVTGERVRIKWHEADEGFHVRVCDETHEWKLNLERGEFERLT